MILNPHTFLVLSARGNDSAHTVAQKIARALSEKGELAELRDTKKKYDLVIAIGGDATVMRVASAYSPRDIPTFGINAGDVGFLTSGNVSEWETLLERIRNGQCSVEKRITFTIVHEGMSFGPFVNDVVLHHPSSVAGFDVFLNGERIHTNLYADGIIVSTPTGSTAYNTSAGGPILFPTSSNVVVTPLNPMMLSTRSIVIEELAQGGALTIVVVSSKRNRAVVVRADSTTFGKEHGFVHGGLIPGEEIRIVKHSCSALFATCGIRAYIKALHEKKGFAR